MMFRKAGKKIQSLAKVLSAVLLCAFVFCGCFTLASALNDQDGAGAMIGLGMLLGGGLASWLIGLLLYGFGQIVENAELSLAIYRAEKRQRAVSEKSAQASHTRHRADYCLSPQELNDMVQIKND